ncbi:hypothetical protein BDC45DRAFT_533045 [Circinella umbellata]|nr:hypothetical protein BDC45DRAFT_533045 [Circinella umbellata]
MFAKYNEHMLFLVVVGCILPITDFQKPVLLKFFFAMICRVLKVIVLTFGLPLGVVVAVGQLGVLSALQLPDVICPVFISPLIVIIVEVMVVAQYTDKDDETL